MAGERVRETKRRDVALVEGLFWPHQGRKNDIWWVKEANNEVGDRNVEYLLSLSDYQ